MAIKAKIAGAYQNVAGVFVKRGGVYGAVAGVFAKMTGEYTSILGTLMIGLVGQRWQLPSKSRSIAVATANSFNGELKQTAVSNFAAPKIVLPDFGMDSASEGSMPGTVTWAVSLIDPAGAEHPFTFSAASAAAVTPGGGPVVSDALSGVSITSGQVYYLRWHGTLPSGAYFESNLFTSGGKGIKYERGIDLASKNTSGGCATTGGYLCMPCGMIAEVESGHRSLAAIGDSILESTDTDPFTLYALSRYDYIKLARSGAASVNRALAFTRQAQLLATLGVTDVFSDFGINDLSAGNRTAAQTLAGLNSIFGLVAAAVPSARIYQSTITPHVTDPTGDVSDVNQAVVAALADGRRQSLNTTIRALGITGQTGYVEWAFAVENALDDDWWIAGYSADGLHPDATEGQPAITARMVSDNAFAL